MKRPNPAAVLAGLLMLASAAVMVTLYAVLLRHLGLHFVMPGGR